MITAWRITKRKHAKTAFRGEGARLYGGRWNSPGIPVNYASESQSLAALEMLVHLDSSDILENYIVFEIGIDEKLIIEVSTAQLPGNWRKERARELWLMGDDWIRSVASAVLRVPSTWIPSESNFLLNPRHMDFERLHTSVNRRHSGR